MNNLLTVASCLHIGADTCRMDLIDKWIRSVKKTGAKVALIGDTLDMGMFVGTAHSGSTWENDLNPEEQIDEAVSLLGPIRGNIEAILSGNHEDRLRKATSIRANRSVADRLGLRSKFYDTIKLLRFGGVTVFLAHGAARSDFNNVLRGWEGVDVVALGHTHTLSKEVVRRRSLHTVRDVHLVRSGTFLEEPRYGKMALYPPNPLGAAWIKVTDGVANVSLGVEP